jgi:hypothetical protein
VLGFVVCRTEIAKCSPPAPAVVEPSIDSQIALLAAAGVGSSAGTSLRFEKRLSATALSQKLPGRYPHHLLVEAARRLANAIRAGR